MNFPFTKHHYFHLFHELHYDITRRWFRAFENNFHFPGLDKISRWFESITRSHCSLLASFEIIRFHLNRYSRLNDFIRINFAHLNILLDQISLPFIMIKFCIPPSKRLIISLPESNDIHFARRNISLEGHFAFHQKWS